MKLVLQNVFILSLFLSIVLVHLFIAGLTFISSLTNLSSSRYAYRANTFSSLCMLTFKCISRVKYISAYFIALFTYHSNSADLYKIWKYENNSPLSPLIWHSKNAVNYLSETSVVLATSTVVVLGFLNSKTNSGENVCFYKWCESFDLDWQFETPVRWKFE